MVLFCGMRVVVHNCPFISCLIFELELNRKPMLQTCSMSFDYIHKKTNRLCAMCFSYDMTLEFSAVIFGAEKEFELSHLETCEVCSGTGAKIGSKMRICSTCGGRGQVMRTEQTPFGLFSQVTKQLFSSCSWILLSLKVIICIKRKVSLEFCLFQMWFKLIIY